MKYDDLKQAKTILETYKISDFKQLDFELADSAKEVQATVEAEILALQENITQAESNLIEVPKGVDERIVMAINEKNGNFIATDIVPLQVQLEQKQQLLSEIQNG